MPELDWPGAVAPMDCRPEAYIISGIQNLAHMVVFGFEIQEPEWSGWESYIPRGIQYFSSHGLVQFHPLIGGFGSQVASPIPGAP